MYPRLEIDIKKIKENISFLSNKLNNNDLDLILVTKSFCALTEVLKELEDTNIKYIADSRISNLKKNKDINKEKILIRIPMLSEVEDVIKYSDISFNSELKTVLKLNEEAKNFNVVHKIVLMVDLGDLREGYINIDELYKVIEIIKTLKNIKLIGLATNLTCYGGVLPTNENLNRLMDIKIKAQSIYEAKLDFLSGGNSSSLYLIENHEIPKGITNLRLGESVLLGVSTADMNFIDGMNHDVFKLQAEIIEIKEKPSIPIGEIGFAAFGVKPTFEDRGIRKRAILAIGKQDVNIDSIVPCENSLKILGGSSDHMIIDITDSMKNYKIGDIIDFNLNYSSLLMLSTSEYVYKKIKK
ncbi:MAG: ornithine racemase Orr [Peptostreptococcaceae bacterium]|jgi:predicted amino acid racemase|nr:ornithine racemase Orr [Peptostreptococcaceae bacterium]